MPHLTAIIQITNCCNLNCRYCYIPKDSTELSIESFCTIVDKLVEFVGEDGSLSVVYHGGEPLLRGYDFFEQSAEFLVKKGKRCKIEAGLQTNGTLLDDQFADLLATYKISCGISIDGPAELHNANRAGGHGDRGSFIAAIAGLERLRSRGLHASAIAVLTKNSLGQIEAIYDFFNKRQIDFKLNPVDLIGRSTMERAALEVTSAEYGQALVELFDIWFEDLNSRITISNLYEAMRSLTSGCYSECLFSNQACGRSYLGITPDGSAYPCSRFSPYPNFKVGNLLQDSVAKIFDQRLINDFANRSAALVQCRGCEYRTFCNGGCASRAYSQHHTILERDLFCPAIRLLFGHITKRLEAEIKRRDKYGDQTGQTTSCTATSDSTASPTG